jgi:hypothetical protein
MGKHWPVLDTYGTFLFGCLAPDVDKICEGLEQSTTHFVGKEESPGYMWQRTDRFLSLQTDFLRAPFWALEGRERAFVMGYVCHVATDEITARLALVLKERSALSGRPLPSVDAILTVMDPLFWAMARDPEEVTVALEKAEIPSDTFRFTSDDCLRALFQIVLPQVQEGGGLESYLGMVRRQWQWVRHRRVSDATDDPDLEVTLARHHRHIEVDLPTAERWLEAMDRERFLTEAVDYCLQRLQALQAEEMHE